MKFYEMKKLGMTALLAIAATSAFSMDANAAGNVINKNVECKMAATTEPSTMHYQQADGNTIQGRCFEALNNSQGVFDETINEEVEDDPYIMTALNSMKKEAKTNPEAAKMRTMYLEARAQFMNDFLQEYNLNKLGTQNDQKASGRAYEAQVRDFINKDDVKNRIKALKAPLHNQAEKMMKFGH